MKNTTFENINCSIARSLEIIGEWWTLLIIREAFFGTKRFNEFEENLGIARNILAQRLSKLVEAGILIRVAQVGRGNPVDYRLTEKGRDLFPVLIALMQWGDNWINQKRAPITVIEKKTGIEISKLRILSQSGDELKLNSVIAIPGEGADENIIRRSNKSL